jgi:hypothetical protein
LASSVAVMTASVTPLAAVADIGWPLPSGRRWSAGHSPARAPDSAPKVSAAAAVSVTNVRRRLNREGFMVCS